MSKIARIRILNLNYNNNTIKIDDETFDLGGQNTLISLRNGGGKSVLVQMIVSLFVNRTYRDFGDRPFKSYFTTNRPTFLQSKWFPMEIEDSQIRQIESSIQTAKKVRPQISTYVVCVPRDLGSKQIVKGGGLAQNTEADRWITLVEKCKLSYPDLEIIE